MKRLERLVNNYLNHHLGANELYAVVNEIQVVNDNILVEYEVSVNIGDEYDTEYRKTTLKLQEV